MIGYRIGSNGNKYEAFKLNGFGEFFALDLWEMLFNPNLSIIIRQCKYCGDFFKANSKKFEYCEECREIKDIINNKQYRQNPIYKLKKSIIEKLQRNRKFEYQDALRGKFETEFNYYYDMIKTGESAITPLPTYRNDIKTQDDLIKWLEDYEDSVRIYKKKKDASRDMEV